MKRAFRLFKRGKVWYYRLPGDTSFHSTGSTTRGRAEQYVLALRDGGRPSAASLTLQQFVAEWHFFRWGECRWIKARHARGYSFTRPVADQRRRHLDNHILPRWAKSLLADLDGVDIEQWLIGLGLSNQTKNHIRTTFNIMLTQARRQRLIRHNPIGECDPLPARWAETGAFTLQELARLFPKDQAKLERLWAADPEQRREWKGRTKVEEPQGLYWATFFLLMATSGMRHQEVRALKWQAVRPDLGGILVLLAIKEDGSVGEPKGREYRGILLPQRTLDLLERWHLCTPKPAPEEWVFFGRKLGEPVHRRSVARYFSLGLERAEIPPGARRLIPHSLRHTYNTVLKGVLPGSVLRELTGHRSERMSERYDHPELEYRLRQLQSVREQIEQAFDVRSIEA